MNTNLMELRKRNIEGQRQGSAETNGENATDETTSSNVTQTTKLQVAETISSFVTQTTDPLKDAYIAHLMAPIPPVTGKIKPRTTVTSIRVRDEILEKLKSAMGLTGLSQQEVIGEALVAYYQKIAKKGGR